MDVILKDNNGVVRTKDAVDYGISRTTLGLLVKNGVLENYFIS